MKKVAIVGGGASGLLSAIFCARANTEVTLFEQNNKCAKKILVSGNGRCNITNKNLSSNDYFTQNPNFNEYALNEFGFKEFEKFANSIGLLLDVKKDGRAYPITYEAKSVARLLEITAKNLGVTFKYEIKIENIKELLRTYDAVIVASGSRAGNHLGGNNDGELFAKTFGHNIIPAYPSLVQLEINSKILHKMSGAKIDAKVTLLINHKPDLSIYGDILFTNYGVSGFAILDISQKASISLLQYQHVSISINMLPNFTIQTLSTHIINISKNIPKYTILDILNGLIPIKIATNLLDFLKIEHNNQNINMKLAKKIANAMLNFRFDVDNTHGFRHAEVSGGGIDTKEISPKTMESLRQKNLYFCGEVLDIVGRRGGYNFAFAWASAFLASKHITKN